MGIGSNLMVELKEQEYQEHKEEWIRDQLGDPDADEYSAGWDELSDAYDELSVNDESDYDYDFWDEQPKSRSEIFSEAVAVTEELLKGTFSYSTRENILIMLHGHLVAALEGYLSSTFIHITLLSEDNIRKLVESDPEFANRTLTIKEFFIKKESLKSDIAKYLQDIIFHKIEKVRPMYRSVLEIDFGDVSWLFKAVATRHHCVHRAGYDKDGNKVIIAQNDIEQLKLQCCALVDMIQNKVDAITLKHFNDQLLNT